MIRLRDVMKTSVQSVAPRDSATKARERMRQGRIRHLAGQREDCGYRC